MKGTVGSTTTTYIGNYFECSFSVMTKYYYAGTTRVAMRDNGTLRYLLGDHLGSSNKAVDASGVLLTNSEIRYKAWGEQRYPSGASAMPTTFRYTGQRQEANLGGADGLYYYNARWFDSYLSRWTSPDLIIPDPFDPIAYDRYAYVFNNPLRYIDPSGYTPYCSGANIWREDCVWTGRYPGGRYGITMTGNFTYQEMVNIISAAEAEGEKLSQNSPYNYDPWEAFRDLYNIDLNHPLQYEMDSDTLCGEGCWGRTLSDRHVLFYRYYMTKQNTKALTHIEVNLIIHENGHAFENALEKILGVKPPRNKLAAVQSGNPGFPGRPNNCGSSTYCGFAGSAYGWQWSKSGAPEEEFADMFIGWVFSNWENTPLGEASGQARSNFMTTYMPLWIDLALNH